jgi:hypothetical protein
VLQGSSDGETAAVVLLVAPTSERDAAQTEGVQFLLEQSVAGTSAEMFRSPLVRLMMDVGRPRRDAATGCSDSGTYRCSVI